MFGSGSLWSRRFEREGLSGLKDRAGRGRKPWLPAEKIRQVITRVVQPPRGEEEMEHPQHGRGNGFVP
jgi:transposase